mgnify:CR=1 FL=1
MNINKENRICSNPMNAPMHEKKRFQTAPIPRTESKKKVIKKQKPNKLLDNKTDNKKTKIKLQYT